MTLEYILFDGKGIHVVIERLLLGGREERGGASERVSDSDP